MSCNNVLISQPTQEKCFLICIICLIVFLVSLSSFFTSYLSRSFIRTRVTFSRNVRGVYSYMMSACVCVSLPSEVNKTLKHYSWSLDINSRYVNGISKKLSLNCPQYIMYFVCVFALSVTSSHRQYNNKNMYTIRWR